MRRIIVLAGVSLGIWTDSVSADRLKNSLSQMIHQKETMPAMVDLNRLEYPMGGMKKPRSPETVIAIVNGEKIQKKEADAYLKKRTQGKVANFDALPLEQRKQLVKELVLPTLIAAAAEKELSAEEKESIYLGLWMRKKAKDISVSEREIAQLHQQMQKRSAARNPNRNLPPLASIRDKIKSQIIEKKIMDEVMKGAKIEVTASTAIPPMMIRPSQSPSFLVK